MKKKFDYTWQEWQEIEMKQNLGWKSYYTPYVTGALLGVVVLLSKTIL